MYNLYYQYKIHSGDDKFKQALEMPLSYFEMSWI